MKSNEAGGNEAGGNDLSDDIQFLRQDECKRDMFFFIQLLSAKDCNNLSEVSL